jgi:hypothetical protein
MDANILQLHPKNPVQVDIPCIHSNTPFRMPDTKANYNRCINSTK